jgi:lipoprotein-releasing system permease protein
LRTIGATGGSILRIFLMAGAMIGVLGTFIGIVLGVVFCLNISTVQSFIEIFTGPLFPQEQYQLAAGIPAKMVGSEVAGVAFWGFLVSALATFFPAWSASKVDPVEALRYE